MGETDPAARVVVPPVRNERQVYVTRAEMLRLARACPHRGVRAVIRIAFYSGMRFGEIVRAEVAGSAFVLADTRNGDPRIIPVHPRIRTAAALPRPRRSEVDYWYPLARNAAGLPHVRIHDLRHAAAAMVNAGVSLYTVGAVLGHRSTQSTKRYAHLATETLSDAITLIGQRKVG